jgi:hypothetical protein
VATFTIFHPPLFHTQSPRLLGIGWGNRCDALGRGFFAVPMILAARGWFPPRVLSVGTIALHRVFACRNGCRAVLFGSDAPSFYGGLVGTHGFLRGAFIAGASLAAQLEVGAIELEFGEFILRLRHTAQN